MKIYIAAPFFNEEQLNTVKLIEIMLEENDIEYFSPRSEGVLIEMTPEEKERKMIEIFDSNIDNLEECDAMIAIIDDWDTGTVFEIGYFYGLLKPIFTYSNHNYGLNVMVRQAVNSHNTDLQNLRTNLMQYTNGLILTHFDQLSKDVT